MSIFLSELSGAEILQTEYERLSGAAVVTVSDDAFALTNAINNLTNEIHLLKAKLK